MSIYKYSVQLLQEAEKIEKSEYFSMFNDEVRLHMKNAVDRCTTSRDDVRFYQGMVEAFNIILGKNDRPSIYRVIKEKIEKGVAEASVPTK